jgi:uncharacterized protein (TIGR01244 family)
MIPVSLGGIQPLHRFSRVYLAGQPGEEDFQKIAAAGLRTVINLRQAEEISWDESAAARRQGLEYHNIPFQSPESLTAEVFVEVLHLLEAAEKHPLLLHCDSGNRAGALWFAHRRLNDGISEEAALKEAEQVGLKTAAYLDRARAFIDIQR